MIARALNALGLRSAPVEPVVPVVHVDWEAKFKLAATDLAKQAEEIEALKAELVHTDDSNRRYASEIDELRPDALLWRNARDKRAKNRGGK